MEQTSAMHHIVALALRSEFWGRREFNRFVIVVGIKYATVTAGAFNAISAVILYQGIDIDRIVTSNLILPGSLKSGGIITFG
jgi:hypothetical protein